MRHLSGHYVRPRRLVGFCFVSPDLAAVAEIAQMLEVPVRTAKRWVNRSDFPPPVDELSVGRIWRRADVEKWAKATLPLKRGPAPRDR
jgi:hypothetical protein